MSISDIMNTKNAFRLDGKVAMVTGAARGVGAAIAKTLAGSGAKVLLTDVLEEQGVSITQELREAGANVEFFRLDVTDEKQWEDAIAKAIEYFGAVDVLVNNAGIELMQFATECDVKDFRRVLDVNVTGAFLGCKHAVRAMSASIEVKQLRSIINISSTAGITGVAAMTAYCASKGAVRLLSKSLAMECAQLNNGIRVNSIYPGMIETGMADQLLDRAVELQLAPDYASAKAAFQSGSPLGGGGFGEPIDIALAVLYLASDASKWVTGAEFVIDGGQTA